MDSLLSCTVAAIVLIDFWMIIRNGISDLCCVKYLMVTAT